MPLICNMWPRCRHVQWRDENGTTIEPTLIMLATVEVAVYPWRCEVCKALGYPYYVPRGSHLMNAEIAAEAVFHAAQPEDSFEEVFRKADLTAFMDAPIGHFTEGPLGGWGPGAGWDPGIPENDITSTASSCARNDDPLSDILSNESIMLPPNDIFQTASPNTSPCHEACDQSPEVQRFSGAVSSGSRIVGSLQPRGSDYGHQTVSTQAISGHAIYPDARPEPFKVTSTSLNTTEATPSSSSLASTSAPGTAASSRTPGDSKTTVDPTATTTGLSLVLNGVTYPRIENGKERCYTQRPGRSNSYSRYSDLAKFDTSKGIRLAPKASKAQLDAARRYRTFG